MKLRLDGTEKQRNYISAVEDDHIRVHDQKFTRSLIISTNTLHDWAVSDANEMDALLLQPLLDLKPEIIVIGTGPTHIFPSHSSLRLLIEAGVGYELMTTTAACRTYNVLLAEDREVVAGLILP
ncbi:MAG: hypothetical protein IME93_06880 [Proteobacteria bacterium]|nr:hypothetical protein [Pseudomonadota bacterium]